MELLAGGDGVGYLLTSLSGRSSPRSTLPKIRTFRAPCTATVLTISSR